MLAGIPPFYSRDVMHMYKMILENEPNYRPYFSEEATSLIADLLQKDKEQRLGSSSLDAKEIKKHQFFEDVDWNAMENLILILKNFNLSLKLINKF